MAPPFVGRNEFPSDRNELPSDRSTIPDGPNIALQQYLGSDFSNLSRGALNTKLTVPGFPEGPIISGFGTPDAPAGTGDSGRVPTQENHIAGIAGDSVGQQMWKVFDPNPKNTSDGNFGCAASVSAVLQQAGYSYTNLDSTINPQSPTNCETVSGLQQELLDHQWTVTATPKPGDVVFGFKTDPQHSLADGAHTGIVGPDGKVYNNQNGTWQATALSDFNTGKYPSGVVFLQPPSS